MGRVILLPADFQNQLLRRGGGISLHKISPEAPFFMHILTISVHGAINLRLIVRLWDATGENLDNLGKKCATAEKFWVGGLCSQLGKFSRPLIFSNFQKLAKFNDHEIFCNGIRETLCPRNVQLISRNLYSRKFMSLR